MYRFVTMMLLCLLSYGSSAQDRFPFRQLMMENGLSQNSVIAIAQDGKGFMWFGTRDGLNRYDGKEFRVYREQREGANGLIFSDVHTLFYDEAINKLWIGTTRGLCMYRETTDDFVSFDQDPVFADRFIHFIFRDREQELWVGTDRGLYRYVETSKRFVRLEGLPEEAFRTMVQDEEGKHYVGMPRGLYLLKIDDKKSNGTLTPIPLESIEGVGEVYVQDLLMEPGGYLWVASRFSGLFRVDLSSGEATRYDAEQEGRGGLSDNNVRTIEWGADGSLWAGTFVGLNRLTPGQDEFEKFYEAPLRPNSLRNHSIHSLFTDRLGTLWLGSYFGGVAYYDKRLEGVRHYSRQVNGLSNNVVSAFAETSDGDLWVGTEGGGLNFFDRSADTFYHVDVRSALGSNNIKSLLLDNDRLWIGTYQGQLAYLDMNTRQVVQDWPLVADSSRQDLTNAYDLLLRNDTLWIANYGDGIALLDIRSGEFKIVRHQADQENTLISNQCRSLNEDSQGNIWVATQEGVSRISMDESGELQFTDFLQEQVVYVIQEDRDGKIWAGTYGQGLFTIDPIDGSTKRYEDSGGSLSESTIYSILRDDKGSLWVSGSEGIAGQDPATGRFRNFDGPYNLIDQEYRINSAFRSRAGELIFGGTEGMTLFEPTQTHVEGELPPVVFTKLQVANEEVPIQSEGGLLQRNIDETEELTLRYDNANFSLSFAPLDYLSPDNYRYQYKLEGLDEDWINSRGETTVNYTLQNAGRYRFRVRVSADQQEAIFSERELRIRVLPPPWRSWYAYLGYILIIGLLLVAVARHAYLQHQLTQEQLKKDQQEALHQAKLRFFTNITHELRTPLTLMLGPLESVRRNNEVKGDTAKRLLTVEKNSRRLLQLVNELLSFRKLNGQGDPLRLDGHDMVEFCREIVAAFQAYAGTSNKTLRFVTDQEQHLVSFDRDKIEKVVYNLLANAFKFTAEGGNITLRLRREGTKIQLEVSDDGEGIPEELHERIFARFFERKSLTNREGTGIGLAVVREYVEMHGGEISVKSQPGQGSTFSLWIPLRPPIPVLAAEVAEDEDEALPEVIAQLREKLTSRDKPDGPPQLILIVEDNEEVRDYIESVLVDDYRLITAVNGKEGLEMAKDSHPDLIVSDVMMPVMDGVALCSALKGDISTSHIPIILLTAKSSDLQKLEGLETGANDYITKPFSPRELQLRVHNLLLSIKNARERTGRTLRLEPAEVQVASADATFLELAIDTIDGQMENSEYRVDDFARDLAVSRALLFTKMKAITGHTPNNFIKLLRMKRAAQLLETGELTVSEVAGRVGYKDVKYFSKSFAKAHGCNPSVYGCQEEGTN